MFQVDNPNQAIRINKSSMLKLKKNYIERHDLGQNMSIRTTSIFKPICNIKYKLIIGIKVEKIILQ